MKSVVLVVLDGFGIAPPNFGNAIHLADPKNINNLFYTYPNTTLRASGEAVGLPMGEVGNTEVGHINLGAGRIVYQDLPRINMAIADGSFFKNPKFLKIISHLNQTGGKLHLIGLIGQGSVHSNIDHLIALLFFAKEYGLKNVCIHAIADGRDSPPKSASEIFAQLSERLAVIGTGKIVSIAGRYYPMDRDKRWERVEKAYRCYTQGAGEKAKSVADAIQNSYSVGKTDEFIEPTNIVSDGEKPALIEKGDAVVFFNFRIDRPRELAKAFVLDNFEADANKSASFDPYAVKYYKTHIPKVENFTPPFARGPKIPDLLFVTMTEYEKNLPAEVAFPPMSVHTPLGSVLADQGVEQLRMAESEKERFVTYYFNGQKEQPFPYEQRIITPSPKVATYDLKPEMSAYEQTDALLTKMREKKFRFILINFANPDMVGHTGNIQATMLAVKAVDACLAKIVQEALNLDYTLLLTADHGNAEQKINPQTGSISTEHTANPVPFVAISKELQNKFIKLQSGILADVAPTILALLDIPKPSEMTGRNLLEEVK